MEIPYAVDERPDTGLNNGKIGIWLFLASEVMLFGALFATYIMLRVGATDWPLGAEILNVKKALINTIVLITSSVTMVMAWASLVRKQYSRYQLFMFLTVGLALVFMCVKYLEYTAKFDHHLYPSSSTFLAIYFTLTALHGLHVLGGMVVILYFAVFGRKLWDENPQWLTNRVENTGLFWHFVDLVWIFLFPILYLL